MGKNYPWRLHYDGARKTALSDLSRRIAEMSAGSSCFLLYDDERVVPLEGVRRCAYCGVTGGGSTGCCSQCGGPAYGR